MKNDEEVVRAYSMASYPVEKTYYVKRSSYTAMILNDWADVNPGVPFIHI